ncbi:MAG: PucR family transcriptional regulator ligand-binding domain-containing protein [Peptococcaceae bacterium]|nr:PucR family transcriptional regulator ligand-binding domain-containing protein [Peptococcaceae bacterium]
MGITVEKFMDLVSDYKLKLVAGENGLGNIAEWFHFVEHDRELLYLNEKELVFSTGGDMQDNAALLEFIRKLLRQHCSGLVLSAGCCMGEVSKEVVAYCHEYKFPLLKAPDDANISDIVKLFCLQILESEKANKQLFSAMKNAISFPQKTELYIPTFLQYGFRKKESYTTVIIEIEQIQALLAPEIQWLVKSIEQTLLSAGDKSFVLNMEGIFVLVLSNYTAQAIRDIVLKIIVMLRMKEYTFFTGVSSNLAGLENLSSSYLQAKQTIDLSVKKDWKNMLVHYDELGVYQLLLSISDKTVKQRYYESVLGKLEQYDKNNRSNYLDFLGTYLECNCNINETADKLFVHRNTVVYKINKISEMLDVDLSDMEVKVGLYLAKLLRETL